jgi:hypothetical protein
MQGQGRFTPNKIAVMESIFTQQVSVVARGIGARRYYGFDLNAGCGFNKLANCIGTPLAFRRAAAMAGMPDAFNFCCELDPAAASELAEKTRHDESTFVTVGRNQDFVETIPDIIRQYGDDPRTAYGHILIDPNDHRRDAIPYDGLRMIAQECGRIDVFLHHPQLAMKRIVAGVAKGTCPESAAEDCFDIDDLPEVIGKNHLWIRQTSDLGNFAIVVGRNTDKVNDDKSHRLARWESDDGLWYRERCKMKVDDADRRHRDRLEKKSGQRRLW